MNLQIALAGVTIAVAGAAGYCFPAIRNAEDLLPDHDTTPAEDSKDAEVENAPVTV
jgi:hypothetical protein